MTSSRFDDFREFAEIINPRSLHQFLAVQAWTLHSQVAFMETWVHADAATQAAKIVHIPRDRDSVDFHRRLAEAAQDVARTFDWSISELAEQVASVHADVFYVRVRNSTSDGTISLRQASSTIDAIQKMVKSAAIITNNPHAKGTGRSSERVSAFLNEDLRMGHTRRGSFIITVAARLQERPAQVADERATPERTVLVRSDMPAVAEAPAEQGNDQVPGAEMDFTRRVMTTLSRSLDVTKRHLARGDDFMDIESAQSEGMTVPIVEALEEIATQALGSSLDLVFEWSQVISQKAEVPRKIVFEPVQVGRMLATIERMKRHTEPTDVVDVIGPVVSLSREKADGAESGEVQLLADIEGRPHKVGIDLIGVAYDWAIYAHRHHLPFSVQGVLGKVGNRWKVIDRLSVNTDFLQRYQTERMDHLTGERPGTTDGPVLD